MTHLDFLIYAGAACGFVELCAIGVAVTAFFTKEPKVGLAAIAVLLVTMAVAHAIVSQAYTP